MNNIVVTLWILLLVLVVVLVLCARTMWKAFDSYRILFLFDIIVLIINIRIIGFAIWCLSNMQ